MATVVQYRYVGFSNEAKPTTAPGGASALPAGALFAEQDTGLTWLWDGTRWAPLPTPPGSAPVLAAAMLARLDELLAEVRALRLGMVYANDSVCTDIEGDLSPVTTGEE